MNPFSQRSSVPSSFLTGLIGWIGFIFIGPLVFGFKMPSIVLFLLGLGCAVLQVAFLRAAFFLLQMQRGLFIGAFWGLVSAIGLYYLSAYFFPELKPNQLYWLLIYGYIGAPVGAFLSYFYIDDKKIFDARKDQLAEPEFGRDAHWLEPFAYGAIAYLIAFFPFNHLDLAVNVFIVGALVGVVAAGSSHFSPDRWKKSFITISLLILGLGIIFGILSGLLFRAYADQLFAGYLIHGIAGGILTFFMTFMRGKQLALKEERNEL